jgi:microcystin-dependent protein
MSFPTWNSDPSFNKITSSYFKDLIDLSGNFIIRNGTIKSPANTIEFDDTFSFINIPNSMNVLTQLKANYDSVEYDVGLQCEKVDTLVSDVGIISPIVYDSQFKLTGQYWDNGLTTTVFTNNVSFQNGSISSLAINNSSFVALTGAQTIDGIKTFNSAPVMSGGSISVGSIPINRVSGTAVNLNGAQSITATKTFTVAQTFSNNIRLDGSLLLNVGTLTIPNTTLAKLPFISSITSDIQTQTTTNATNITTNTNDISTANTNITALQGKLTNVSFTTPTTSISGTTEANVLKFNTSLNTISPTIFGYLSNVSSDIQSQFSTINTNIANINAVSLSASNTFTGALNKFVDDVQLESDLLVKFTGGSITLTNDNLTRIQYISGVSSSVSTSITNINTSISTLNTKTTKISYMSVGGINTTTILDGLISQTFSFTGTINNITPTVFGYISGLTSSAQTQLNNLATKLTGISYSGTTTTVANTLATATLTFSGTLNNISTTVFGYLSGVSSSIQTQLNNLSTNLATTTTNANDALQRATDIEYSGTPTAQTTISNKLITEELQFNTDLNNITPTTFGYLSGVSSSIQTQLNSKTDSLAGTIIQHIKDDLQTNFPTKYLLCNGQSVSRTTYANLFSIIGTTYGSVNGSSFNVPDFQACFLRMYSSARNVNGTTYTPSAVGTIQQDALQSHVHSSGLSGSYLVDSGVSGSNFTVGSLKYSTSNFPSSTGAVSASQRTADETRPLNHSVYFYITC